MPLDDMVQGHIDFMKIDVEGAEWLVISGGIKMIESSRPIITAEFSPEMLGRISKISAIDYFRFFTERNYKIISLEIGRAHV